MTRQSAMRRGHRGAKLQPGGQAAPQRHHEKQYQAEATERGDAGYGVQHAALHDRLRSQHLELGTRNHAAVRFPEASRTRSTLIHG